jgi:hypothetical protein
MSRPPARQSTNSAQFEAHDPPQPASPALALLPNKRQSHYDSKSWEQKHGDKAFIPLKFRPPYWLPARS